MMKSFFLLYLPPHVSCHLSNASDKRSKILTNRDISEVGLNITYLFVSQNY